MVEHRKHKRYNLNLAVALVDEHEAKGRYHGITRDISNDGCSILLDHNLNYSNEVRLLLSLDHQSVIEIYGRNVYTVYSGSEQSFRMGIQFVSFKRNGQARLEKFLASKVLY